VPRRVFADKYPARSHMLPGRIQFTFTNQGRLRRPTAIDCFEAPPGATLLARISRAVKLNKNGFVWAAGENANRDPARLIRLVLKFHVIDSTVSFD